MRFLIFLLFVLLSNPGLSQSNVSEEIIVSAVGRRSIDEIISTTDIVEHEGLDRNINSNIGQILENIPGISSASFGRAVGRPVIRGLGDYRVQILENDLGGGDVASTGPDHPHAQNALAIQKLEILKGPASLRFGPFAATGVINMLSEHKLLTLEAESGGDLLYGYSSVAKEDAFHFHALRRSGNWFFGLSGHSRDGKDYKIPSLAESRALHEVEETKGEEEHEQVKGIAKGTALDEKGLNLHSTYIGNNFKTTVFFNVNDSFFGVPLHAHSGEEEETVDLDMKRDRIGFELNYGLRGFFSNILLSTAFTDYQHREIEDGKVGTQFQNDSTNVRLELTHTAVNNWSGLMGLSSYDEIFEIKGAEKYLPSADTNHTAVFVLENYEKDRLLLEGAARLDKFNIDPEGTLASYSDTSSSLSFGGGYKLRDSTLLGLSIAKNTRSPSTAELYANGPHIGPQVFEVGSFNSTGTKLKNEKSDSTEGYFRFSNDRWHLHSSIFYSQFYNFIYGHFTGQKKSDLLEIQYRQSDATIKGVEIELGMVGDQIAGFDIDHEFSFSSVSGKLDGGGDIPRIPPLTYQYTLEAVSENWLALLRLKHSAKQNDIGVNELVTGSHSSVDIEISWIPSAYEDFTFSLLVRNLTDEEIRNHTSYLKDRLPEPGRDINLTIQYGF